MQVRVPVFLEGNKEEVKGRAGQYLEPVIKEEIVLTKHLVVCGDCPFREPHTAQHLLIVGFQTAEDLIMTYI